jgi:hypothetical protein
MKPVTVASAYKMLSLFGKFGNGRCRYVEKGNRGGEAKIYQSTKLEFRNFDIVNETQNSEGRGLTLSLCLLFPNLQPQTMSGTNCTLTKDTDTFSHHLYFDDSMVGWLVRNSEEKGLVDNACDVRVVVYINFMDVEFRFIVTQRATVRLLSSSNYCNFPFL